MLPIESDIFGGEEGSAFVEAVEEEWPIMERVPPLDCFATIPSLSNFGK